MGERQVADVGVVHTVNTKTLFETCFESNQCHLIQALALVKFIKLNKCNLHMHNLLYNQFNTKYHDLWSHKSYDGNLQKINAVHQKDYLCQIGGIFPCTWT